MSSLCGDAQGGVDAVEGGGGDATGVVLGCRRLPSLSPPRIRGTDTARGSLSPALTVSNGARLHRTILALNYHVELTREKSVCNVATTYQYLFSFSQKELHKQDLHSHNNDMDEWDYSYCKHLHYSSLKHWIHIRGIFFVSH